MHVVGKLNRIQSIPDWIHIVQFQSFTNQNTHLVNAEVNSKIIN